MCLLLSRKMPGYCLKIGRDHFVSRHFLLIVHQVPWSFSIVWILRYVCYFDLRADNINTIFFFFIFCWPCIWIYLFLNINQLDALNFYNKFVSSLYIFRAHVLIVRRAKIVLYSLWYHHTETSVWSKITKIIKIIKIQFYKYEHL